MTGFSRILLLLGCAVLHGCASTPAKRSPSSLISPVSIAIQEVLHGPPPPGSELDRADLKEVLALQKSRSVQDCARAEAAAKPTLESFFGALAGPLAESEVKRLDPFFVRILADVRPIIGKAKDMWSRLRPAAADSRVSPCLPNDPSSSYPSGHAMVASVFARSLGLIFPERRAEFLRRADQIVTDRVLSGLHFRTDVQDGQRLGDAISKQLEINPEFQATIQEMRGGH